MAFNPIRADLYTDFAQFSSMKAKGGANSPETVTKVARQFESLLVQMVLKSMREATLGESLLDSDQSDFYRDLYDKQLAIHLTRGSGLGLADLITRQLGDTTESNQNVGGPGRELGDYRAHPVRPIIWQNSSHAADRSTAIPDTADAEAVEGSSTPTQIASRDEFIAMLRPHAMQAGRELGVHPGVLLAQAALESGWGAKRIRHADGVDTYNLFGIKADSGWQGRSAVNSTLEYDRGIPVRQHARFRSYQDLAAGFQDYVRFIRDNPRYSEALKTSNPREYIQALQDAGYATDPDYARKVLTIFKQNGFSELVPERA